MRMNARVRAMLQAAHERGRERTAAEQRWRDDRERVRLRQLLGLNGGAVMKSEASEPALVKRRKRRPTIDGAMKQATKAGVPVSGATISADGSVTLAFGKTLAASSADDHNEWDEVYKDGPH